MAEHLTLDEFARGVLNPMLVTMIRDGRLDDALLDRETGELFDAKASEVRDAIYARLTALAKEI
jgi:hypothetical protein